MKKEQNQNLVVRPPIVVVMGHIDHGKTTLLDQIRKTRVAEKESGGITQHVGAYQVTLPAKAGEVAKKITFLDTPGHEAFFQMRSRGAKVADIALLVIDVSEGVKAQTKEVISHIKQSELPTIVVLNKIDRPEANPEKTKRELAKEDILVESMGGKIPTVEISAKTGQGIPELLELILLVSEIEKITTDQTKPGQGVVVESYLDNFRGPTATLLLTEGTIKTGDVVATNSSLAKIKSLEDFQKKPIDQAFPSDPVIIFGFDKVPKVGEEFKIFPDLEQAQNYVQSAKEPKIEPVKEKVSVTKEAGEKKKILNLILKADVAGSLEAIEEILRNLPQENVILKILKSEVGNINESDVKLALSSEATILGFRVKTDTTAQKVLEREKIRVMTFDIIYELVEGIRNLMEKFVSTEMVRVDLGKVKVLAIFFTEKNRQIVGGKVIEGEAKRGTSIEVYRNEQKIGQGKMVNLKKEKKDVESIPKGGECGILFEGDVRIAEGDVLVIYTKEKQ